MEIDFGHIEKLYELVKDGVMEKAEGKGFKIYDMKNGTVRVDIKTLEKGDI